MRHIGPYRLTPAQSLAWHSEHVGERETLRREVRAAVRARARAAEQPAGLVLDVDGRLLERVDAR